jgi:hypothetical protein
MPEDVTTDNLTPQLLLDGEGWEIAFEPYEGHPAEALNLGCNLGMLRAYLKAQTIPCRQAIKALDLALDVLFPFTGFHHTSFDLFIKYTEVGLTFEEEQIVKALGVEF